MKARVRGVLLVVGTVSVLVGCPTRSSVIDKSRLLGPWTSGGGSFDFDVRESTILYEFDMQEHPYTLEGDVLVVDSREASMGIQRKRILRLTDDVLVLHDDQTASGTEFHRVR